VISMLPRMSTQETYISLLGIDSPEGWEYQCRC
jgi:hypothetical protein